MSPEGMMACFLLAGLGILLFLVFRCTHAWEFVDKTEMGSRLDEAKKAGVNVSYMQDWRIQEMTRKKVVIVLRCPKCGGAKILRESN